MSIATESTILGERALRETLRTPDSLIPTLFIPLFFLVVNTGQAARIFPSDDTPFLQGQNYAAFQLPVSMLLAASFGSAALYLVEEIEGGYFDKLRAAPISRSAIVLGRLYSEFVKSLVITTAMVLIAWPFGIHIESGVIGYVLLVLMIAFWAVVFSGFMQLIALKTRSAAATNAGSLIFFPLLFLTPNFVPRDMLARPMEIAATFNPVTYVMEAARSLILEDLEWATIGKGYLVVAARHGADARSSACARSTTTTDTGHSAGAGKVACRADGRRPVRRGGAGRPGDAACVDPRGGAGGVGAEVPGLVRGSRRRGARGAHRLGNASPRRTASACLTSSATGHGRSRA